MICSLFFYILPLYTSTAFFPLPSCLIGYISLHFPLLPLPLPFLSRVFFVWYVRTVWSGLVYDVFPFFLFFFFLFGVCAVLEFN